MTAALRRFSGYAMKTPSSKLSVLEYTLKGFSITELHYDANGDATAERLNSIS